MTKATSPSRPLSADRRRWVWTGYATFMVGMLYALWSAYWAMGGSAGLDELGGKLAELARQRDPTLIAVVWVTVVLKAGVATFGLALVQPWGRRLPSRLLLTASWGATAVLVSYGALLVCVQLVILLSGGQPDAPIDRKPFYWHLFLWDPWFLLWGLLLGSATWAFVRTPTVDTLPLR